MSYKDELLSVCSAVELAAEDLGRFAQMRVTLIEVASSARNLLAENERLLKTAARVPELERIIESLQAEVMRETQRREEAEAKVTQTLQAALRSLQANTT